MELFYIKIADRLVRVEIVDERGAEGAVPTLVCERPDVQVVPVTAESSEPPPPEQPRPHHYPRFPLAIESEVDSQQYSLQIDVTALPSGSLPFALTPFAMKVHE